MAWEAGGAHMAAPANRTLMPQLRGVIPLYLACLRLVLDGKARVRRRL